MSVELLSSSDAPYKSSNLAINRFFVWCLCEDLVQINGCQDALPSKVYHGIGQVNVDAKRSDSIKILDTRHDGISKLDRYLKAGERIVVRHGPSSALRQQFPNIYKSADEHLRPRNMLDQTREIAWPENVFGRPSKTATTASSAEFQFERVTVSATLRLQDENDQWLHVDGTYEYEFGESKKNAPSALLIEHHCPI